MIAERARLVTAVYLVADLAATAAALWAAHAAREWFSAVPGLGPVYPFSQYVPLLAIVLPLWGLIFHAFGLYGRRSSRALRPEVARLLRAIGVGALLLLAVVFVAKLDYVSRALIALFLFLDILFIAAGRAAVRAMVLDASRRRRVLVAGSRDEVARVAREVDAHRDWGLGVIGVASDGTWEAERVGPYRVLGAYADIPRLMMHGVVIDEVIFAPATSHVELTRVEDVLLQLEELGVVTRLVVNVLPRSLSTMSFDEFGGVPLLTFSTAPRDELLLFVRRCVDLALSASLLVVLSPVFLLLAAFIKLTSPGAVLFRQIRCGLHGRPFVFLKFRSMRTGAEGLKPSLEPFNEMDGPAFKMTDDPRVTPLGRFLRRTSLDELPQLWNILRGDMSFVGPRPAVLEEVRQYEPWQRRRLSMQPGLTCLWQISGRNELSFDEWMRLDLQYIDNWSLWLDLKIAVLTLPAVVLGRGAR